MESVRTLAETHLLIGERRAYRVAQEAAAIQVPATVQATLAARIDRVTPEDKRLLQAAAVIGTDVPFTLLQETGAVDARRAPAMPGPSSNSRYRRVGYAWRSSIASS